MVLKHQADLFADSQWSYSNFIIQDLKIIIIRGVPGALSPRHMHAVVAETVRKKLISCMIYFSGMG